MSNVHGYLARFLKTAAVLAGLLTACSAGAQVKAFIAPAGDAAKDESPSRRAAFEQIMKQPTTDSVTVVNIDVSALTDASVDLRFDAAKTMRATRSKVERRDASSFTWVGRLNEVPGDAIFVIDEGRVTGSIRAPDGLYKVRPLDGTHALIKVNENRMPAEHPPVFRERTEREPVRAPASPPPQGDAAPSGPPPVIDVLVAYTAAAQSAVGDMQALIRLAMLETNQSYEWSGIGARLNLVHTHRVTYAEANTSYDNVLTDFAGRGDGRMDEIHALRDQYGADVAVLIFNRTEYCGMADAILADAASAFAVVYHDCATGYYSFGHEIGHLQGARHDPDNDPGTAPFPYGHGYREPSGAWRTVMAYNCPGSGCPRQPCWSTPARRYHCRDNSPGTIMGDPVRSNNARVLNETASLIASFRPKVPQKPYPPSQISAQ